MLSAGIPSAQRFGLYTRLVNAEAVRVTTSAYASLVDMPSFCDSQIELDVARTFAECKDFARSSWKASLFRILHSLSLALPGIGYCQGLSYVAGFALRIVGGPDAEENAFILVYSTIVHHRLGPLYDPHLSGLSTTAAVFESLLGKFAPRLAKHLRSLGVEPLVYITPWYMTLFSHVEMPAVSIARIWDLFMYEGIPALHRVSLAIMLRLRPVLINAHGIEDALRVLLHLPHSAVRADALLETALDLGGTDFIRECALVTEVVEREAAADADRVRAQREAAAARRTARRAAEGPTPASAVASTATTTHGAPSHRHGSGRRNVAAFAETPTTSSSPAHSSSSSSSSSSVMSKLVQSLTTPRKNGPPRLALDLGTSSSLRSLMRRRVRRSASLRHGSFALAAASDVTSPHAVRRTESKQGLEHLVLSSPVPRDENVHGQQGMLSPTFELDVLASPKAAGPALLAARKRRPSSSRVASTGGPRRSPSSPHRAAPTVLLSGPVGTTTSPHHSPHRSSPLARRPSSLAPRRLVGPGRVSHVQSMHQYTLH